MSMQLSTNVIDGNDFVKSVSKLNNVNKITAALWKRNIPFSVDNNTIVVKGTCSFSFVIDSDGGVRVGPTAALPPRPIFRHAFQKDKEIVGDTDSEEESDVDSDRDGGGSGSGSGSMSTVQYKPKESEPQPVAWKAPAQFVVSHQKSRRRTEKQRRKMVVEYIKQFYQVAKEHISMYRAAGKDRPVGTEPPCNVQYEHTCHFDGSNCTKCKFHESNRVCRTLSRGKMCVFFHKDMIKHALALVEIRFGSNYKIHECRHKNNCVFAKTPVLCCFKHDDDSDADKNEACVAFEKIFVNILNAVTMVDGTAKF